MAHRSVAGGSAVASNPASQPRRSGRQRALRPLWQHRPPRKTHVARRRSALPTLAQTTSQGPHRAARPPCTATCRRLACSLASFFRLLCVHSAVCVCASSGCVDAIRARSPAAVARLEFPDHDQTGRYREVLTIGQDAFRPRVESTDGRAHCWRGGAGRLPAWSTNEGLPTNEASHASDRATVRGPPAAHRPLSIRVAGRGGSLDQPHG